MLKLKVNDVEVEIEERNNLDLIVEKKNTIPYLVDQHLLDKKNV